MVLFVLEAHGALHFGRSVDKRAQRIAGQRMIIAAGVDVLELAGFVIVLLRIDPLEQEALNLIGRIQRVAFLFVQLIRHNAFSTPRMSAAYGVPSLSMTSPKTSTLPEPKKSAGAQ